MQNLFQIHHTSKRTDQTVSHVRRAINQKQQQQSMYSYVRIRVEVHSMDAFQIIGFKISKDYLLKCTWKE